MPLIKSIAGVRGTIGGLVGESLTPLDVVNITAAFGRQVIAHSDKKLVIIGRDARPSGILISQLVAATMQSLGFEVIDAGLSTTPTVCLAIPQEKAGGGIVITASHNPANWNALKLFNQWGEYIDEPTARRVFELAAAGDYCFSPIDELGTYHDQPNYIAQHIAQILALPLVDVAAIRRRKFKVVVDAVNSTGGLAVPQLLQVLGVDVTPLYCTPTGIFPHNPEPVAENLGELLQMLQNGSYDLGIAVDPDVDRLAIIDQNGIPWGEDYTLVAVADYVLGHTPGNTVSNLSSSSALAIVTQQHGGQYAASPVGEMHVVAMMKATQAVVGGEGNGGVIYPPLHYGRDALVGIALLLSYLAKTGQNPSQLRQKYPSYVMIKLKIQLTTPEIDPTRILAFLQETYQLHPISTLEGLKVTLPGGWFHVRQSNTEPLLRIHVEGRDHDTAHALAAEVIGQIKGHFPILMI